MTPLREQLIAALTLKRYSPKTHEAYIGAVAGLARYYRRGPDQICNQEITAYLLHLHQERRLSASTLNVAVSGLRFFYAHVLNARSPKSRRRSHGRSSRASVCGFIVWRRSGTYSKKAAASRPSGSF